MKRALYYTLHLLMITFGTFAIVATGIGFGYFRFPSSLAFAFVMLSAAVYFFYGANYCIKQFEKISAKKR